MLQLRLFVFCLLIPLTGQAQDRSRNYYVDQHHTAATDQGKGTIDQPFLTISRAAGLAGPGDSVIVMSGTYRERVAPASGGVEGRPVVYISPKGQNAIIKGSEIWNPDWIKPNMERNIWKGKFESDFFGEFNPFTVKARALKGERTLGQVFVNGHMYAEVCRQEELATSPGSWMVIDEGSSLLIHLEIKIADPANTLVEVTVRNRNFAPHKRGLGYIHINGFTMMHCSNQFPGTFWTRDRSKGDVQAGALGTRSGHHWIIENNTIRFANTLGIDCGREGGYDLEGDQPTPEKYGYHIIRYNVISDNGACGIAGAGTPFTQILYNLIERNNSLGWTSPEIGGMKFHWFTDGLIEGNIVRDNDCHGIWLDNGCVNSRVTRNVVINSRSDGIFCELADGHCLVDNNIVAYTRGGDGIYTHDCSGVTMAHNLLFCNTHFGINIRVVTNRRTQNPDGERILVGAHDMTILNNIFIDNYRGHISIPLESERVYNNNADYNVYINGAVWKWEGLGLNRFVINMANGMLDDDGNLIKEDGGDISGRVILVEALKKALTENNVAPGDWPNMDQWKEQPYLTFNWWQMMTGWDQNSFLPVIGDHEIVNGALAKGMFSFSVHQMYFEAKEKHPLVQIKCPPVEGVDFDFSGAPIEGDRVMPGPFQDYNEGHNRFVLRPVVISR